MTTETSTLMGRLKEFDAKLNYVVNCNMYFQRDQAPELEGEKRNAKKTQQQKT